MCIMDTFLIIPIFFILQAYQMLKQWRERDGSMAYNETLEKALYECNLRDAAAVLNKY